MWISRRNEINWTKYIKKLRSDWKDWRRMKGKTKTHDARLDDDG